MFFSVLDYLQLLNNEQFLDDLILEHIWNSLSLVVRGFRCNLRETHYISTIDLETFIMDPNLPLKKTLFTSQIHPC